ncbi:alanine dehydrogenase [Desulfotomaculum nigrificans CO-1-SRB]|uniref:Alanine dehydrogenase n=1 Tax=Desulfotomaculum nigrificans (strain DSM 14880 / VKM B-2319 / CO-1-SRB) TaxID=868595 RepID=F6B7D2_DESCC|nr:alanine dehydrogenase [Desulfotomaculum nigrificans]AEF93382.1 alanine dehydrogenase [Desulfotomaculum nigrificans CO-1-SRB]
MIVGVPKEIKNNENRVAITPAGVQALVHNGHRVVIENNAGLGSGISNEDYIAAGAEILDTAKDVFAQADMIMKVKEPLPAEYDLFKEGQLLFTYLHLAPEPELTAALLKKKVTGIAYETIQLDNGALPLLSPMSEVAGRMSIQVGAHFLEKTNGGQGILLGGVAGVPAANVVILGGGIVGTSAAKMAMGLGADVTILDVNIDRLRYLDDLFGGRIHTLMSNSYNIAEAVKKADLLVGCVLIPGARTPRLVTEEMVKTMKPGSVIVDVAIDQGGSIETIDRVTTHDNPTFEKYGVIHYSVANMPGAVARTSTFALTNATMPYALQLANKGWLQAVKDNRALAKGVNVVNGCCTYKAVADALKLEYTPLERIIG